MKCIGMFAFLMAVPALAAATTIEVSFLGSLNSSTIPGIPAGANFFGSFQYRTDAPVIDDYALGGYFALETGALSLTIAGDTYTNDNGHPIFPDDVHVASFGLLVISGVSMTGTGPLDAAYVRFDGSSDPAFSALQLPLHFPADFATFTLLIYGMNHQDELGFGTFVVKSVTETPSVPEPATALLTTAGLAILARLNRKRRRACSDHAPRAGL